MNSVEIRQAMEAKKVEMRKFLDENKLDEAEKVKTEKRELEKKLKMTEELEAEEKRDLEAQAEKDNKEIEERKDVKEMENTEKKDITAEEARSFAAFVRGENRALSAGDNGGIIPTSISNKILEKVKELSPIYNLVTVYNISGDLVLPRYDETNSSISAAYIDEFTELTEGTGKFTTIKLQSFIVGVLAKVSKSLINKSDFDVTNFVINEVAKKIAQFLEHELLVGTDEKMTGVLAASQTMDSAGVTISFDDIFDLEAKIPDLYLPNACFIMHKTTRTALKKIKNTQGEYILQKDLTSPSSYSLLGHPVYTSENMPVVAAGNKAIVFGDMSGLAMKLTSNIQTTILTEKYATQYATGVCAYIEVDSDIQDNQKLAVLKVKSA
ncbi:phage major capsid protein [Clostridium sp. 19966]|uniref:phage major capsid protein n=1 Tax=Clostridium sp. 19966 TaxID=2768166 RepID=UPI0028DE57E2|nr:phage major capsid protein [Clostridium sp. 19966]MDT8718989.1 phage major capsid protein [Clostridium sp. 19966]